MITCKLVIRKKLCKQSKLKFKSSFLHFQPKKSSVESSLKSHPLSVSLNINESLKFSLIIGDYWTVPEGQDSKSSWEKIISTGEFLKFYQNINSIPEGFLFHWSKLHFKMGRIWVLTKSKILLEGFFNSLEEFDFNVQIFNWC